MDLDRRELLKSAGVAMTAFLLPLGASRPARAALTDHALVAVFQRGAADGLNLVVPHGDARYYAARPTLAIPAAELVDLDGFFGLAPALAPLAPLYQNGRLAVIHAAGSPDGSRSHFDCQDHVDRGAVGDVSVTTGWLNRFLGSEGTLAALSGVSVGYSKAPSLAGPAPTLALPSLSSFRLTGRYRTQRRAALSQMHGLVSNTLVGRSADEAFDTVDLLAGVTVNQAAPYPDTDLGGALRNAAALLKAQVGVRVIAVSVGGWDTHSNQAAELTESSANLAASLAAFHADLGAVADRTVVVTMTEFGRELRENGAAGTEHGHGSVMFALGGGVGGGRVLLRGGAWPGLAPTQLFERQDLAVTTDFRDVFAEILVRHMGSAAVAEILPGFPYSAANAPGLFA